MVLKFGGTSVGEVESIRRVVGIVAAELTALRDLRIHLLARPSGGRTLACVLDATHAPTAMARLHACFFGGDVVQA